MTRVNPDIFKAYDIRGVYQKDFNDQDGYLMAKIFGKNKPLVVVSHDVRKSSFQLYKSVLAGLKDSGAKVIAAGVSSTPMHYFIINHIKADGGIMITASHLAAKYNGFKLSLKGAKPLTGKEFYEYSKKEFLK